MARVGTFSRQLPGSFAFKLFLGLMAVLQSADGLLTYLLVSRGLVQEGNFLVRAVASNGEFVWIKVLGAIICGLALWQLSTRFNNLALAATCAISGFYTTVFAWNLLIVL